MLERFTNLLYDFIVCKGYSLEESLRVLSGRDINPVSNTCKYLFNNIIKGHTLAEGMESCPFIKFNKTYIAFIKYAEINNNLNDTITFLMKQNNRKKIYILKFIEMAVYPALAIFMVISAYFYFSASNLYYFGNKIYIYLILLTFICIFTFSEIKRDFYKNKIYEAFYGISFLLKYGVGLYDAIYCNSKLFGLSVYRLKFQRAGEKLLRGMSFSQAFYFCRGYLGSYDYDSEYYNSFNFFEKLAECVKISHGKKQKNIFLLTEMFFVVLIFSSLFIFISKFFLPYTSSIYWL